MLALLTTLRFRPSPEYTTALPSCHRPSLTEPYDRARTVTGELRLTVTNYGHICDGIPGKVSRLLERSPLIYPPCGCFRGAVKALLARSGDVLEQR